MSLLFSLYQPPLLPLSLLECCINVKNATWVYSIGVCIDIKEHINWV
jgi:hypothetical protein